MNGATKPTERHADAKAQILLALANGHGAMHALLEDDVPAALVELDKTIAFAEAARKQLSGGKQ